MQRDKDRMDSLLQAALDMAAQAFAKPPQGGKGFVVAGESNLLNISADTDTVRGPVRGLHPQGQRSALA